MLRSELNDIKRHLEGGVPTTSITTEMLRGLCDYVNLLEQLKSCEIMKGGSVISLDSLCRPFTVFGNGVETGHGVEKGDSYTILWNSGDVETGKNARSLFNIRYK